MPLIDACQSCHLPRAEVSSQSATVVRPIDDPHRVETAASRTFERSKYRLPDATSATVTAGGRPHDVAMTMEGTATVTIQKATRRLKADADAGNLFIASAPERSAVVAAGIDVTAVTYASSGILVEESATKRC